LTYTADNGPPDGCEEVWCRLSFKVAIALTDLGLRRLVCLEWRIKMLVLPTFYFANLDSDLPSPIVHLWKATVTILGGGLPKGWPDSPDRWCWDGERFCAGNI